MKKGLIFVLVLVLLAVGAWLGWEWWQRVAGTKAPQSPAVFLPPDTLFYAEVPNGASTYLRYRNSKAAALWQDEQWQGVLAALGAIITEESQALSGADAQTMEERLAIATQLAQAVGRCMGGTSFVAVTGFTAEPEVSVQLVAGFHGAPDEGLSVDRMVDRIKEIAGDKLAGRETGTAEIEGVAVEWLRLGKDGQGIKLFRARWEKWDLFAIDEDALADFLRSVMQGRADGGLAASPAYQDVWKKIDESPDAWFYADSSAFMDIYFDMISRFAGGGEAGGETSAMMDVLKKKMNYMHSILWTVRVEQESLRDRIVAYSPRDKLPDLGRTYDPVALQALRFTGPDTLLFTSQSFDVAKNYAYQMEMQKEMLQALRENSEQEEGAEEMDPFAMIEGQVAMMGLDLHKNIINPLGPELAIVLDWPEAAPFPELLIVLEVSDEQAFRPSYQKLVETSAMLAMMGGHYEEKQVAGYDTLQISIASVPMLSPTVFLGKGMFGIGLTAAGTEAALAGANPLKAEVVAPPTPGVGVGPSAVAYVRTDVLMERGYGALIGLMPMAATWLGGTDGLPENMPETLTFTDKIGVTRAATFYEGDYTLSQIETSGTNAVVPMAVGMALGMYHYGKMDEARREREMVEQARIEEEARLQAEREAAEAPATPGADATNDGEMPSPLLTPLTEEGQQPPLFDPVELPPIPQ